MADWLLILDAAGHRAAELAVPDSEVVSSLGLDGLDVELVGAPPGGDWVCDFCSSPLVVGALSPGAVILAYGSRALCSAHRASMLDVDRDEDGVGSLSLCGCAGCAPAAADLSARARSTGSMVAVELFDGETLWFGY